MHSTPALMRLRRLRGVASLVVLGFLCRALIPAGFMPAAIGAGGPVVVCHGGLAGEFFRRLEEAKGGTAAATASAASYGEHAPHGAHPGSGAPDDNSPAAVHEGWEYCPFGATFGTALLAGDVAPALLIPGQALEFVEPALPVPFPPVTSYRARAPPAAAIHS